ncbi:MAG TPA: cytochrome P450 [Acidimicrobiia bacterium]|nr:cytochrome P450 [Acidimicrobiia bacterium]
MGSRTVDCPTIDVDLWADDVLADPYPTYAELRELGAVLYTPQWDAFVLPRYDEVRAVLQDWQTFSSAQGVGLNARANAMAGRGILTTDPPLHDTRRKVLNAQLVPREVGRHHDFLVAEAERLVGELVRRGTFEAMRELAEPYSVGVVADLCGLPTEGREHLVRRASAAFDTFGPDNARSRAAWPGFQELFEYARHEGAPPNLTPGRWGTEIYAAAADGEIEPEACPGLMLAYVWAGMDTTVNALGAAVSLFADHPDQWDRLRADRSLLASAVNEVLRIEPPVQRFTRCATRAVELGGVTLPEGARLAVLFGSANRDPRRFADPDRFDIGRNPTDHLSFGRGVHRCVGAGLAQEEMKAVIASLADRVARFEVGARVWRRNNALHGLERLDVSVVPA